MALELKEEKKVLFQLNIHENLDRRFREFVARKHNGTRKGALSAELEVALNYLLEKKGKQYDR